MRLVPTENEKRTLPPTNWEGRGRKVWLEVQVAVSKGPYDEVTLAELKAHDEVCQRIASIVDNLDGMTADDTRQWWQTCIVPDNSYALADEWASALREMGFKVKIELRTRAF
jgi:hypothetical protein